MRVKAVACVWTCFSHLSEWIAVYKNKRRLNDVRLGEPTIYQVRIHNLDISDPLTLFGPDYHFHAFLLKK